MATAYVEINNTTWTQVLDGEGFAICGVPVQYAFNTTATITEFFTADAGVQVNSASGQILYAKSPLQDTLKVAVSPLV